jgi:hypothetical protein
VNENTIVKKNQFFYLLSNCNWSTPLCSLCIIQFLAIQLLKSHNAISTSKEPQDYKTKGSTQQLNTIIHHAITSLSNRLLKHKLTNEKSNRNIISLITYRTLMWNIFLHPANSISSIIWSIPTPKSLPFSEKIEARNSRSISQWPNNKEKAMLASSY